MFSQLIRGLPRDRFAVYCASLPRGRFYEETAGRCAFLPLDLSRRFDLRNIGRLEALLLEHRIDVVHSQGARADFYCAVAASRAGVKAVATVAMPVEGFDVCYLKKKIYSLLYSFAEKRLAGVITVSGTLRDALVSRHGLPPERVALIPNPVDTAEFDHSNFDAGPLIEKFGLRGRLVLGALGRLEWQKGYPYLIDAVRILTGKDPELKEKLVCLIGGAGRLETQLKRLCAEAGVAGNVVFCGEVAPKEFLSAVDIFVMPSLLEGQPLALLEAMAMAKPIVATDIPGINDTAVSGSEALLVPPKDPERLAAALAELVRDHARAAGLGRNALLKAGAYGVAPYIDRHVAVYAKVLGI